MPDNSRPEDLSKAAMNWDKNHKCPVVEQEEVPQPETETANAMDTEASQVPSEQSQSLDESAKTEGQS